EALTERARSMAESNLLKSEFLAGVANEIRTPLNAIIGFSAILTEEYFGKLSERQKEYSRGILDSAEELVSVIEGTLDLATVEAGLMTIELDTVDIKTLLSNVRGLVRERARQRNINIEFDCPADIGWLIADEKRLRQSLFNLVSAAIHSTPPNGGISIVVSRDDDGVSFEITDGGLGLKDYDIPPGVALVTRFIELHGGSVMIKSQLSKGTSITCRLPIDVPPAEVTPQPDLFS
ncbi:MAG: HAMP domain-containing histidine kinase, partial [Rhodospirillaceae bacterium]|nr:HAMP domain-containing histidine kinase [Rhodospirillaceae bacterium]